MGSTPLLCPIRTACISRSVPGHLRGPRSQQSKEVSLQSDTPYTHFLSAGPDPSSVDRHLLYVVCSMCFRLHPHLSTSPLLVLSISLTYRRGPVGLIILRARPRYISGGWLSLTITAQGKALHTSQQRPKTRTHVYILYVGCLELQCMLLNATTGA